MTQNNKNPAEPFRTDEAAKIEKNELSTDELGCPHCGGPLWKISERGGGQYQCRIGHHYSLESLSSAQIEVLEQILMTALRTLKENALVTKRLAERARKRGHSGSVFLDERAEETDRQGSAVESIIATLFPSSAKEITNPPINTPDPQ